jgi:tRNA threonylcarbamoyladenosine biosynthesis protein TsaE
MAKGIARGLGIRDEVTSPTFTIVSEYEGRLRLHHIDAYRLGGVGDFVEVGGEDLVSDEGGLCLVEWSERVEGALPSDAVRLDISVESDGTRLVRVSGAALEAILE